MPRPLATAYRSCSIVAFAAGRTFSKPSRWERGAVLVGRPYAYGLAVGGEQGVHDVLANLIADIDLTLGLSGRASFAEVSKASVVEGCNGTGV